MVISLWTQQVVQKLQVINSKFPIKEIDNSFLEEVKKRSRN